MKEKGHLLCVTQAVIMMMLLMMNMYVHNFKMKWNFRFARTFAAGKGGC